MNRDSSSQVLSLYPAARGVGRRSGPVGVFLIGMGEGQCGSQAFLLDLGSSPAILLDVEILKIPVLVPTAIIITTTTILPSPAPVTSPIDPESEASLSSLILGCVPQVCVQPGTEEKALRGYLAKWDPQWLDRYTVNDYQNCSCVTL
jgi:hypothetical protein